MAEEKEALPGKDFGDNPVDLNHLSGHIEMKVTEMHCKYNDDESEDDFIIVMRDQAGNHRIGTIGKEVLKKSLKNLGYDPKL